MFTFTIDRLNMLERDDIFAFTTAAYIFSSPNNSEHLKMIVTFVTSLQQLNSNQTAILPAIFFYQQIILPSCTKSAEVVVFLSVGMRTQTSVNLLWLKSVFF